MEEEEEGRELLPRLLLRDRGVLVLGGWKWRKSRGVEVGVGGGRARFVERWTRERGEEDRSCESRSLFFHSVYDLFLLTNLHDLKAFLEGGRRRVRGLREG